MPQIVTQLHKGIRPTLARSIDACSGNNGRWARFRGAGKRLNRERIRSAMLSTSLARPARLLRAACVIVAVSLLCGLAWSGPAAAALSPAAATRPGAPRDHRQPPVPDSRAGSRAGGQDPQGGPGDRGNYADLHADREPGWVVHADRGRRAGPGDGAGGTWRALNPRLTANANGTWSPAVSTYPLTLSGGGTGPLATMNYGGYSPVANRPVRLPVPSVSGQRRPTPASCPGSTSSSPPSQAAATAMSSASRTPPPRPIRLWPR